MERHFSKGTYITDEIELVLDLSGEQGNAYAILGFVSEELKDIGFTNEEIAQYDKEATSSDYTNLLNVSMSYVCLIDSSEKVIAFSEEENKYVVV